MCVLLITRLLLLVGKLSALKTVYHTSGVDVVTPTDRFKSDCNRCVIEGFGGVFVLSCCFLDFSVGVGSFVIGLSLISVNRLTTPVGIPVFITDRPRSLRETLITKFTQSSPLPENFVAILYT